MKYKIYKLVEPRILEETVPDGYNVKVVRGIVLEEVDIWWSGLNDTFNSLEEVMNTISENADKLKNENLTILPIIKVNWEGGIF